MGIVVNEITHWRNGAFSTEAWAGTNWWVSDGVYSSVDQSCRVKITTDDYGASSISVSGLTPGGTGNRALLMNVSDNSASFLSGSGLPGVLVSANGTGYIAINLLPRTTYYVWLYAWRGDWSYRFGTSSIVVTSAGAYGTAATAQAADGYFGSAIPITVTGGSAGATYTVEVSCAGRTETLQTQSANTNLTWTPDLATYAELLPNAGSATATLTCTTYYGGTARTPTTSTITVSFAPGALPPTLSPGWASHAFYNTGSAAASIAAYVQGYSKAEVSFDSTKIACQYGASVAGYEIACGGVTVSASPYRTPVLTGTTASIVCAAIDSRGQRASETLTVSLNAYATPTLTAISIYRSDAQGYEDDDGTYISVTATANISSISGLNSYAMEAYSKTADAAVFSDWGSMTTSVQKLLSGHSPDVTYDVKVTLEDALGNSTEYNQRLAPRIWAMKFRPDGRGVGFGKAPEHSAALEVPASWALRFGGKQLHPDMLGATEEGATAAGNHTAGEYFLWDGSLVKATAAISAGDALAALVQRTSIARELEALAAGDDTLYTGTLAKLISGGTADFTTCVKKCGVVTVGGRVHTFSQSGTSIAFFNIPDGFRPPAPVTCLAGYLIGGNIGWVMIPVNIGTDGNVTGGYSQSASYPVQQFSFSCSYHI